MNANEKMVYPSVEELCISAVQQGVMVLHDEDGVTIGRWKPFTHESLVYYFNMSSEDTATIKHITHILSSVENDNFVYSFLMLPMGRIIRHRMDTMGSVLEAARVTEAAIKRSILTYGIKGNISIMSNAPFVFNLQIYQFSKDGSNKVRLNKLQPFPIAAIELDFAEQLQERDQLIEQKKILTLLRQAISTGKLDIVDGKVVRFTHGPLSFNNIKFFFIDVPGMTCDLTVMLITTQGVKYVYVNLKDYLDALELVLFS